MKRRGLVTNFAEVGAMKAPKYQRAEMPAAALQEAVYTFEDPVEGLEITDMGVGPPGGSFS
jgi:hypothetical protein